MDIHTLRTRIEVVLRYTHEALEPVQIGLTPSLHPIHNADYKRLGENRLLIVFSVTTATRRETKSL